MATLYDNYHTMRSGSRQRMKWSSGPFQATNAASLGEQQLRKVTLKEQLGVQLQLVLVQFARWHTGGNILAPPRMHQKRLARDAQPIPALPRQAHRPGTAIFIHRAGD